MELQRWKFSKHVKSELEEFLECVKNQEINEDNLEKGKMWHNILPKLPLSTYCLEENVSKQPQNDDIIIIDTDSEDVPVCLSHETQQNNIPDVSIINLTLIEPSEELINPNLQEFVEYLLECFTNDSLLQNDDIKKICSELNTESLKELFKNLSETASNEGLLKFGKSLCKYSISTEEVARQYSRLIFLNKLTKPDSIQIYKTLVKDFSKVYSQIAREEIFLPLLNNDYKCGNIYQIVLNTLEENEKENLIRDFVFQCSELEDFQLLILQPLVRFATDFTVKRRLINLMSVSADKFNDDKLFIKILIELIKNLERGFIDQEPILYEMIDKNKTLLKATALKTLNEWFDSYDN